MQRSRKFISRTRRFLWYGIAVLVVTAAVAVSVARVFLPDVKVYRERVEQGLGEFLDHKVSIDTLDARLIGFTPTLIFKDVHMFDRDGKRELVSFEEARLGIAFFQSIKQGRLVPASFTIEGIVLAITRRIDGSFLVQGVDISKLEESFSSTGDETNELADWLLQRASLGLEHSTVLWKDLNRGGKTIRFDDVNINLKNNGDRHQLTGKVKLPKVMGKNFEFALDVTGDALNPLKWKGEFYFRGDNINLGAWGIKPQVMDVTLQKGQADFVLWGDWQAGTLRQIDGELAAYQLVITTPKSEQPVNIELLGGLFSWQQTGMQWTLKLDRFQYMGDGGTWPNTQFSIVRHKATKITPATLEVKAGYLRMEEINSLLLDSKLLPEDLHESLQTLQLAGDIHDLHIKYAEEKFAAEDFVLRARFEHVSTKPWNEIPGMQGINGSISMSKAQGELVLDSNYAILEFPNLFRDPFTITGLSGRFGWYHANGAWNIQSERLLARNNEIETSSGFLMVLPDDGTSPFMDLQVNFKNGDASTTSHYLPVSIMDKGVVDWLDRSIVSGHIVKGGAVFHGRLSDFPFDDHTGQFIVQFSAKDMELDYQEGWPRITDGVVDATFTGQGMAMVVNAGKLQENRVKNVQVGIESFFLPHLRVTGEAYGSIKDTLQFITNTPVLPEAKDFIETTRFTGKGKTTVDLRIPLSDKAEEEAALSYSGAIETHDGALYMLNDALDITHIDGRISFNEDGPHGSGIKARILGGASSIDVYTLTKQAGRPTQIVAKGIVDVAKVTQQFDLPGAKHVKGKTPWQGVVTLGHKKGKREVPLKINVSSELLGVEINLPEPLKKSTEVTRKFSMSSEFVDQQSLVMNIAYGDRLTAALDLDTTKKYMRLRKGELFMADNKAALPKKEVLRIKGVLSDFSLGTWLDALEVSGKGEKQHFFGIPIVFDMDYLQIAKFADDEKEHTQSETDPRSLPIFKGVIRKLVYDDMTIGQVDFSTVPTRDGLRLKELLVTSPELHIVADGQWKLKNRRHQTLLNLTVQSTDLGKALHNLGYAAIIDGGQAEGVGKLRWNDTPANFSLTKLAGKLDIKIEDGSIIDIEPGAGRLVGLLSLSALPRRLMLDFRDTFKEGFSFDEIKGTVTLKKGNAVTENLLVKSPVALITVKGRTGLAQRDYDQLVSVVPQVGDTLPTAGWALGGPQVGAVILFFQTLFGSEINKAAERRYRITGSWDDPVIERLDVPEDAPTEEFTQEEDEAA